MSDVNLHVALLWALVGQWFCMAAKLESRQSLTLGDVSLFGPNTKLLGLYVMKSAQTHFMSPSQQRGFILTECWKRWRGDITLTLTNGRAQLHSCSTYQREGRRVSFVRVWGLYCIQTTGSFSVAPPSLESDLMVLEPKIGFWNMFHSAYCLQVDYAVSRIVGSFLWIEIQYYNHPKKTKKHALHITDRMSRRNVIKCRVFVTDLLNFVTCANTMWRVFPVARPMRQILCWICDCAPPVSAFHDSLLFVQKMTSQWRVFGRRTWWTRIWSQSFGKSSAWPTTTSTWSSPTPTWESRWGPSLALLFYLLQDRVSKHFNNCPSKP